MADSPRFAASATRIGRTDLGPSQFFVEGDSLVVALQPASVPPIRVSLDTVDAIAVSSGGDELTVRLNDGTHIELASAAAAEGQRELLVRCRGLPEMTRALRALGSRRRYRSQRTTATVEQQRFFAALLAARRAAHEAADPSAIVAAFDAVALGGALEAVLHEFALARHGENAPARRALEAELTDLAEPLAEALKLLGEYATELTPSTADLVQWREWLVRVRAAFEAADRVWASVDVVLDTMTVVS